jgi:hypothetical protein
MRTRRVQRRRPLWSTIQAGRHKLRIELKTRRAPSSSVGAVNKIQYAPAAPGRKPFTTLAIAPVRELQSIAAPLPMAIDTIISHPTHSADPAHDRQRYGIIHHQPHFYRSNPLRHTSPSLTSSITFSCVRLFFMQHGWSFTDGIRLVLLP